MVLTSPVLTESEDGTVRGTGRVLGRIDIGDITAEVDKPTEVNINIVD